MLSYVVWNKANVIAKDPRREHQTHGRSCTDDLGHEIIEEEVQQRNVLVCVSPAAADTQIVCRQSVCGPHRNQSSPMAERYLRPSPISKVSMANIFGLCNGPERHALSLSCILEIQRTFPRNQNSRCSELRMFNGYLSFSLPRPTIFLKHHRSPQRSTPSSRLLHGT